MIKNLRQTSNFRFLVSGATMIFKDCLVNFKYFIISACSRLVRSWFVFKWHFIKFETQMILVCLCFSWSCMMHYNNFREFSSKENKTLHCSFFTKISKNQSKGNQSFCSEACHMSDWLRIGLTHETEQQNRQPYPVYT